MRRITPVIFALIIFTLLSVASFAKEASQEYDLINPESVVKIEPMAVNAHPASLEGKTVVLRANGKHNADNALDRVGELLQKNVKDIKILKLWKLYPETNEISQGPEKSQYIAQKIASLKPDLVIGSSAD
jgi:ABC-type Fe3+-hydroxamate transport system substrate-binding protein